MQNSYIPKWEEKEFCEWINLCTVRKNTNWQSKIWIKNLDGKINETLLSEVINSNSYNWKEIIRIYSSWHIFFSEDLEKVFLVSTMRDWKIQHQFTWWSPLEEENKDVIIKDNWVYRFNLEKVKANAKIRTENRIGIKIIEEYNEVPLVDWVLMENEEDWIKYYKLICLMHFIVKKYEWNLWFTWKENTVWADWYTIDELPFTEQVAANAYVVSKSAQEIVKTWEIL